MNRKNPVRKIILLNILFLTIFLFSTSPVSATTEEKERKVTLDVLGKFYEDWNLIEDDAKSQIRNPKRCCEARACIAIRDILSGWGSTEWWNVYRDIAIGAVQVVIPPSKFKLPAEVAYQILNDYLDGKSEKEIAIKAIEKTLKKYIESKGLQYREWEIELAEELGLKPKEGAVAVKIYEELNKRLAKQPPFKPKIYESDGTTGHLSIFRDVVIITIQQERDCEDEECSFKHFSVMMFGNIRFDTKTGNWKVTKRRYKLHVECCDGRRFWTPDYCYSAAGEMPRGTYSNSTIQKAKTEFVEIYNAAVDKKEIPRWIKNLINRKMIAYIRMKDRSTSILKVMSDENGKIVEIEEIGEEEIAEFNPNAEVHTDEQTVRSIMESDKPEYAFKNALEQGKIVIKGRDVGSKIKYGAATFFGRIIAKFIPSPYDVKQGEEKIIEFKGMKVKLWRSVAGYRTIKGIDEEQWSEEIAGWATSPHREPVPEKTYLVIDENGVVKGYTTHNIQKLLAVNPEGLSPDAGIIAGWAREPLRGGLPPR